jgi:hypothetical protein
VQIPVLHFVKAHAPDHIRLYTNVKDSKSLNHLNALNSYSFSIRPMLH